MNLRELEYVIAVAETRHFGRAAERCFVSQPTLSGQIKKLEDQLGVALFERTSRSVSVTPAGEGVLIHARRIVEEAEAIRRAGRTYADPLTGPVRLGVIPTLSPYLLPWILIPLRNRHPGLHLIPDEERYETLIDRLRHHELEAALVATTVDDPDLTEWLLFDEPFRIAHPADHPLAGPGGVSAAEIPPEQLLLLSDGSCLSEQVSDWIGLSETRPRGYSTELRTSNLETLLQLVEAGFGITVLPALAAERRRDTERGEPGFVARPLADPEAGRTVRLVFRASYPRIAALEALARVILEHLPASVRLRPWEGHTTETLRDPP